MSFSVSDRLMCRPGDAFGLGTGRLTVSYTSTYEHVTQSTLDVKIPTMARSSSEQRTVSC